MLRHNLLIVTVALMGAILCPIVTAQSSPKTKSFKLSKDAQLYKTGDGMEIVIDELGFSIFVNNDGKGLHQVQALGSSSETSSLGLVRFHVSCFDHYRNARIEISGDTKAATTVNGVIFTRTAWKKTISAVPLPHIRVPEKLFSLPGGGFVYVSADKYNYQYETLRLFVGSGTLKSVPITNVERFRDGGTTIIHVKGGSLYWPSPTASLAGSDFTEAERIPTWRGKKIVRLNPGQYMIVENGATVTISKKH